MNNSKLKYHNNLAWLVFVAVGILVQQQNLYVLFDVHFTFTAIIYLAIIRLFGTRRALLAVFIIGVVSYFTGTDIDNLYIGVVEVLFVGLLYRWKGQNILTWDVAFWVLLWVPYYYLTLPSGLSEVASDFSHMIVIKTVINAVVNALIAEILSQYLPRIPLLSRIFPKKEHLNFGRIIAHLTIVAAVIPLFCYTLIIGFYEGDRTIDEYEDSIQTFKARLSEKVNAMDPTQIKGLQLESVVEKAHFSEMFEDLTEQTNMTIYAVDNQGKVFVSSDNSITRDSDFALFDDGYTTTVSDMLAIWLPDIEQNEQCWSNGYYYSTLTILNLKMYVVIPLAEQMASMSNLYSIAFSAVFILFIIAIGFTTIGNKILTKSLRHLTKVTSDLPKRIENKEMFEWTKSEVYEFDFLGRNFEAIAQKLSEMFQEAELRNSLLTKRTEQLVESQERLHYLAHYDSLTGLKNRHTFNQSLEELLSRSFVNNLEFAVVFVDLDKFKEVNDTIGHSGGDELLKVIAQRFNEFSKLKNGVTAYRLGGDEFVFTIENSASKNIENYCSELLEKIKMSIKIMNRTFNISASMGVSIYPKDGRNVEDIINNADTAMYETKAEGKNGIHFYNSGEAEG